MERIWTTLLLLAAAASAIAWLVALMRESGIRPLRGLARLRRGGGLDVPLVHRLVGASKVLVCRSRCKVANDGTLLGCRYFHTSNFEFFCSYDKSCVVLSYDMQLNVERHEP